MWRPWRERKRRACVLCVLCVLLVEDGALWGTVLRFWGVDVSGSGLLVTPVTCARLPAAAVLTQLCLEWLPRVQHSSWSGNLSICQSWPCLPVNIAVVSASPCVGESSKCGPAYQEDRSGGQGLMLHSVLTPVCPLPGWLPERPPPGDLDSASMAKVHRLGRAAAGPH